MGIATSSVNVANGVLNRTIQAFTTDAAAAVDTMFNFGFKPRLVQVINLTDRITDEWFEGMAANNVLRTVAAGTRSVDTSNLIAVNADGIVTLKASVIAASKSFVIVVEG